MKHTHFAFLGMARILCTACLLWFACLPGQEIQAETLFRADFNGSLEPQKNVGAGDVESRGEIRYVDADETLAAVLSAKNALSYPSAGNIRLEGGTLFMRIKPLNWSWQAQEFLEFFRLDDTQGDRSILLLYKYMQPGKDFGLVWLAGQLRREDDKPLWTVAKNPVEGERKEWMLLTATWDASSRLINLYINGEEFAYATVPENQWPVTLADRFFILRTVTSPLREDFETAIDFLQIEDRALSASEIKRFSDRIMASSGNTSQIDSKVLKPSFVSIPRLEVAPVMDGHYGANEWGDAATVAGFSVFKSPESPPHAQTIVHAGYDQDYLYVAFLSPANLSTVLKADAKDLREIGRDDSVEILISPEDGRGMTYQLIANANQLVVGLQGSHFAKMKPGWDSGVKIMNKVYEGRWLVEMAIPWGSMGVSSPDTQNVRLNFCRNWAGLRSDGNALSTSWSFSENAFAQDLGSGVLKSSGAFGQLEIDANALEQRRLMGTLKVHNFGDSAAENVSVSVQLKDEAGNLLAQAEKSETLSAHANMLLPFDLTVETPCAIAEVVAEKTNGEKILYHQIPLQYASGLTIHPVIQPDTKTLEAFIQYAGLIQPNKKIIGTVFVQNGEGKNLMEKQLSIAEGSQSARADFDVKGLSDGEYQIGVRLMDGADVLAETTKAFEVMFDPPWLKDKVGVSRRVLPPWTPMTYRDGVVQLWGRSYLYDGGLLPSRIVSGQEELLSAPAEIKIKSDGKNVALHPDQFQVEESAEDRVIFNATQTSPGIQVSARTTVEYDGMAKVELTLTPTEGSKIIDNLQIRFPFATQKEMFIHAHSFAWSDMIRKRLTGDFQGKFYPYIWIGAEKRGMAWFTESDQGWNNMHPDTVFSVQTTGKETLFEIRLIDQPTKITKPLTYIFGFQATPVKPPLKTARPLRLHNPNITEVSPWAMRDKSLKKYAKDDPEWGWLAPHLSNYEGLHEELAYWKGRGIVLPIYVAPTITSPLSASYQMFKDAWRNPHGSYPFACVASTFADEQLWQVQQMVKHAGLQATYVDCGWAYSCGNRNHGCGYINDQGKLRLTYPIFALRDYFRRLYTIMHFEGNDAPAPVWVHASGLAAAPAHSFCDILTQGEEVRNDVIANPQYFEIYSLDAWRITYGSALGIQMNFLPEFCGPIPKEIRYDPARNAAFVGLALLHDTSLQDGFSSPEYLKDVYQKLDAEGFQNPDIQFEPYWEQAYVLIPDAPDLKVSVYRLPTHALVIIVNPTKKPVSGKCVFSSEWDQAQPGVSTLISNRSKISDNHTVEMQPEDFIALKITFKNKK